MSTLNRARCPDRGGAMRRLIDLMRGWPGTPSHPALTDASIGAYTVGVAMLVAGKLGLEKHQMAVGSLLAISGGLALAAPTAITGLLDWLQLPKGTSRRTTATIHLFTMVTATLVFAGAWLAQRPGYVHGQVKSLGLALGLVAEVLLAAGGYIGGALVFAYGVRVTGWHNVVHIVTGALGLVSLAYAAARSYALLLGVVYVVVAVWGFIIGNHESILGFIPVNTEDSVLHVILGVTGLGAYFATPATPPATTTSIGTAPMQPSP